MSFKTKLKYILLDIFDMISFLVFVGGIVLFIRFFIANPYTVVGASMAPTFQENDFIIVDKITPRFNQLNRGDIIVFVPPGKTIPYIKRIVGLPGETIKIKHNGVEVCTTENTIEQCNTLEEPYLDSGVRTESRCGIDEFKIDGGGLFVMGDNRGFSTDSRCCFGLDCYEGSTYEVPADHIIGKVYLRFFPHFSTF
ncbi:MAG: signal peptidase I [Candidatus Absconditabacterales bacterium]